MKYIISKDCLVFKGYKNTAIVDTTRNRIETFENELLGYLDFVLDKDIAEINNQRKTDNNFDEFVKHLLENEYLILTNNPEWFPDLKLDFESPSQISNAIVEYSGDLKLLEKAFSEISDINCFHVELFTDCDQGSFNNLISFLIGYNDSILKSITLYFDYSLIKIDDLIELKKSNCRMEYIIHNTPFEKFALLKAKFDPIVKCVHKKIDLHQDCGIIDKSFFTTNIQFVSESVNYNSCLNKKVSIDSKGNVRNCPLLNQKYGNIEHISLSQVIKNKNFISSWVITKDKIKVCQDCEFRHVCSDCRAFLDEGEEYNQPVKCNYNPYIGLWSGQEGYVDIREMDLHN